MISIKLKNFRREEMKISPVNPRSADAFISNFLLGKGVNVLHVS